MKRIDQRCLRTIVPPGQRHFQTCSPDGIRTRATALRGRRARPLHNGALAPVTGVIGPRKPTNSHSIERIWGFHCAGVLGLEPRLNEPESAGLPINKYPTVRPWLAAPPGCTPRGARAETLLQAPPPTQTGSPA